MNDIGHLYVLANSAMPGLVKIGKTIRSPAERAIELSSATGLPTPFIVVYEQLFGDCSAAESFVHTYLATKGFRVSDNREFFNAPVNDVVRAIALAPGSLDSDTLASTIEPEIDLIEPHKFDELDDLQINNQTFVRQVPIWESIFEEAENHYYGLGDTLQDYKEAMKMYVQAAKLGALPAYSRIGEMYKEGEGVQANAENALKYFKEGARKGSFYCYWAMGMLFWSPYDSAHRNSENSEKCFSLFLKNLNDDIADGNQFTAEQWTQVSRNCMSLLYMKMHHQMDTPSVLKNFFLQRARSIKSEAQKMANHWRNTNNLVGQQAYQALLNELNSIDAWK